jgi:hypothetical protein
LKEPRTSPQRFGNSKISHPRGSLEEGRLLARIGAAVLETGDYRAAQAAFARALQISAAEHDAGLELRTLAYATSVDHFDLRWSDVLAKSRRIQELARRVDDPRSETYARAALPLC